MEVKGAIQCVKDKYEGWEGYAQSQEEVNKLGKECNEVISLLQDLEKYKEMWEEFDNKYGHFGLLVCGMSRRICEWMKDLEQKYLPQPVKKVITIEVETKNEIAFKMFSEELNKMTNEYFSNVKVNIKEVNNAQR